MAKKNKSGGKPAFLTVFWFAWRSSASDEMNDLDSCAGTHQCLVPVRFSNDLLIYLDGDSLMRERKMFEQRPKVQAFGNVFGFAINYNAHKTR